MKNTFGKQMEQILALFIPQKWIDWNKENNKDISTVNDFQKLLIAIGMVVISFFFLAHFLL
ncbi:hypothetical protein [Alkalihalobacterium elongatum]|uniref:hypothetical protein n=1 Tax=Alkalihalobacterium elongatum TaxID=2675466 RepID=UPI001C1F5113|nr:hypothetical protein [Alkalihalobacterium elongatum]